MEAHLNIDESTPADINNRFLAHDLPLIEQGKLIIPLKDPLFDFQFRKMIITDNRGNLISRDEYLTAGSPKLNNNSCGIDTDPHTKPLPATEYCEFCKCDDSKVYSRCAGCRRVRYCDFDCQKKHWIEHKPHCLIECEVIFTFWHKKLTGQSVHNVFVKKTFTEEKFITAIMETIPLDAPNYHDLRHLVKISTCANYNMVNDNGKLHGDQGLEFRDKNNGKYYFNPKFENTMPSKLWAQWLDKYCKLRALRA